jgi:hypothetical protein
MVNKFWLVLSLFFLWKSKENFKFYYPFLVSGLFTFYSYNPPKIYLPLLVVIFFLVFWSQSKKNLVNKHEFWVANLSLLVVFFLITGSYLKDGSFFARWHEVKRDAFSFVEVGQAYLNHFSLNFLFRKGDIGFSGQFITRHSIRGMGQLYWFQLPLIIFGILSIFLKKNRREKIFFGIVPLLIYPTGSIFTGLAPQATRSVMGVIPFTLLSAIGLSWLIDIFSKLSKKLVYVFGLGLGIIVLISFLNFNRLFLNYPQYSSDYWGWQYGAEPIMQYFLKHKDEYDELLMEGKFNGGHIFIPFYDPKNLCQNKCRLGGIEVVENSKKRIFAISFETYQEKMENYCNSFLIKKEVLYPHGKIAFLIGECR